MNKKELREIYIGRRLAMTPQERIKQDDLLLLRFQDISLENVQSVLSYLPIPRHGEPDVTLCTRYLRHMIPAVRLAYPVADFSGAAMHAVEVNEGTRYATTPTGITEPENGTTLPPESVDLVLVPMVICDLRGYRVGYGKGFYDRYLSRCRKDAKRIGLCYFEPVERIDDTHQFDVPLDLCITPGKVYEF
jgi:5-formyltetrahydrofolate cyclo-ligase